MLQSQIIKYLGNTPLRRTAMRSFDPSGLEESQRAIKKDRVGKKYPCYCFTASTVPVLVSIAKLPLLISYLAYRPFSLYRNPIINKPITNTVNKRTIQSLNVSSFIKFPFL
jgi:hypothetical protein